MELLILFLVASCPLTLGRAENRIIGGERTNPGEFPYQVSIQLYDEELSYWKPTCGGSILNPTSVLCATHCILASEGEDNPRYRIVAGEFDLNVDEGTEQVRDVEQIVLHPEFDTVNYHNDVALFFLSKKEPLEFNKFVQPIKLPPTKGHVPTGYANVTGWGVTNDVLGASASPILKKLTIPIFPDTKCEEIYREYFTSAMFCAGNLNGGEDACTGDSGGPLVANDTLTGEKYLAGIVSWGSGCARENYLGVYTKVSEFLGWIYFVINKLGHDPVQNEIQAWKDQQQQKGPL